MDTTKIEQSVGSFILAHRLIPDGSRVLVAVSGGPDSVALLYILHTLCQMRFINAELICGHVNHQLRADQSDQDQLFVRHMAGGLGIGFVATAVDVRGFASEERLSLETAGRLLRIEALALMARQYGCTRIAVGHQANDNAETIIHRLMRGTGLRGIAGIWPVRPIDQDISLIRPLLAIQRGQVLSYLRAKGVAWREDLTNLDCRFTRNAIRHRLMPILQQAGTKDLVENICSLGLATYRLYQDQILPMVQTLAGQVVTHHRPYGVSISPEPLACIRPFVVVELLRQILAGAGCRQRDLNFRHYTELLAMTKGRTRSVSLPAGLIARRYGRQIWIFPKRHLDRRPQLDVYLQIPGRVQADGFVIEAGLVDRSEVGPWPKSIRYRQTEAFDWSRVRPPIHVRNPRPGDRFVPLGMHREKKVARFLMDACVPGFIRNQVMVFEDQHQIIWVWPIRIADPIKVQPDTAQVLVLSCRPLELGQES